MIKKVDIAWLAGLMDGEGSFSTGVWKPKGGIKSLLIRPRVAICMYTGKEKWADKVSKILQELEIVHTRVLYKANYRKNHIFKESYTVVAFQGKKQISKLCKILLPYLVVKRKQAKLFSTWPSKKLMFIYPKQKKVKLYWTNIYKVVKYLRKSRELNRGLHSSNMKWTPDKVLEYFKSLS